MKTVITVTICLELTRFKIGFYLRTCNFGHVIPNIIRGILIEKLPLNQEIIEVKILAQFQVVDTQIHDI